MQQNPIPPVPMDLQRIWQTWWPLAGSWILMGLELPAISIVVARLANPEIHLAAYGGIVFPISLLIEAPIIMLLAASTALSKNWASYLLLRRFMFYMAISLTLLHILVAFTPLYDVIVSGIMGMPEEILEPARLGLMLMTPWTGSIAVRRFQQGVLIRFGQSRTVGKGTAIRLATNVSVLGYGYATGSITGIAVATAAMSLGVIVEALFVNFRVQPILRRMEAGSTEEGSQLSTRELIFFYWPLAVTPILTLLALPIGSAALSRMPFALESLAVWPVLAGLSFTFRSAGLAYHEVVVALIDRPGAATALRRFAGLLAMATSGLLLLIALTPLGEFWFGTVSSLPPHLTAMGTMGLWFAVLMPALTVMESWYQGVLVQGHQTKAITEAVAIYLIGSSTILAIGTMNGQVIGLYVALTAMLSGFFLQTLWLRIRSRPTRENLLAQDLGLVKP